MERVENSFLSFFAIITALHWSQKTKDRNNLLLISYVIDNSTFILIHLCLNHNALADKEKLCRMLLLVQKRAKIQLGAEW